MSLRSTPLALAIAVLAGCAAVGPDYKGAPPVAADAASAPHFARDTASTTTAPAAATWWRSLDDPALDDLVDRALRASPTLRAAQARLRAARAALGAQEAKGRPSG